MADQALAPLTDHAENAADVVPGEYIVVLKTNNPGGEDSQYRQQLLIDFQRDIEENIQGSLTVTGSAARVPCIFIKAEETAIMS